MNSYEANVERQMDGLTEECIKVRAVPMVLICMDGARKGHMFYPDDLPPEIVAALPYLLDDVRESLTKEPEAR